MEEFITDGTIVFEEKISIHRERFRYKTKNGGIIEYKRKETANRDKNVCLNCEHINNCLEGYADYFRVFPHKKGTFCYMRPELDFDVFDEDDNLVLSKNDLFNSTPLRLCVVGACNFNCGFPEKNISWCLKKTRDFKFPKRVVKL